MLEMHLLALLLLSVISCTSSNGYGQYGQICTNRYNREACNEITRNESYVCSEESLSNIDCFLGIDKGDSLLGIMEPEQSLLASALVSDKVTVIGTVTSENPPYQTALIVRKPYSNFESLRSTRFCHPGYIHDEAVTKYVLDQFESKIISLNSSFCDTDDMTVAEKNIKAVSDFFANSCIPGPWTSDSELDIKWKSKYSNLCDLCRPQKCEVAYKVPFNDTLMCLTQNYGDVALTTLKHAQAFLNKSDNVENFQYLCSDGTVSNVMNPCTWTDQLERLIITEKEAAHAARRYIEAHLQNHVFKVETQTSITRSLEKILVLQPTDKITFLESPEPLKSYVESRRSIPIIDNSTSCNVTVKWCTLNDNEQHKCLWLRQAAVNFGLQPPIECVQSSVVDCVEDIQYEKADFAFLNASSTFLAKKNGLTAVAYSEDNKSQLVPVLIVIRNDTSDIGHLRDLVGKRACFPEYGGKEWLAFVDAMRNSGLMPVSCDYEKIFGDFVGSSCVPGAKLPSFKNNFEISEKLCAQCVPVSNKLTAKYCNADANNKYYTSDGSLRCLNDQNADYAVISVNEVTPSTATSMYRVLCKNGSLALFPGLAVDEPASLTVLASGGIATRKASSKTPDVVSLLRDVATLFGRKATATFDAFGEFGGRKGSLLPDTIFGLTFGDDVSEYVKNLENLVNNSEKCSVPVSGSRSLYSMALSIVLIFVGLMVARF